MVGNPDTTHCKDFELNLHFSHMLIHFKSIVVLANLQKIVSHPKWLLYRLDTITHLLADISIHMTSVS